MPPAVANRVLPQASAPAAVPAPASVFLPKEHGSWSLALEPVALGLLVAPSLAGLGLAAAALAGFFARRPLRSALAAEPPGRRGRARPVLALLGGLALLGLAEAGLVGGWTRLWPLLAAVLPGALFLSFDLRGEARAALSEVSGAACFAFVPATLAALAGAPTPGALSLAAVIFARSLTAILTVRACLRRAKGRPARATGPQLVSVVAAAAVALLAHAGLAPWGAAAAAVALPVRTALALRPRHSARTARQLGIAEAVFGTVYVAAVATADWCAGGLAAKP